MPCPDHRRQPESGAAVDKNFGGFTGSVAMEGLYLKCVVYERYRQPEKPEPSGAR
jgi:hypothetical protein